MGNVPVNLYLWAIRAAMRGRTWSPWGSLALGAFLLLRGLSPAEAQQPEPHGRPNIVVLFADDLGYGDLSSYGHPTIRTERLDRMAREGIRLTSFYSVAPACSPARAALLTGRYPVRSGLARVLGTESTTGMPHTEVTLAEALGERGYRTMAVGKWHLGHLPEFLPTRHGFDHFFGLPYSNDMMPPWVQSDRPVPLMRDTAVIERQAVQPTLTQRYTDEAIDFMRRSSGTPFFLYLAYSMPHLPIYASEQFRGRSRGGLYGDVIEEIDWSAGRVLDTVRELGLDSTTIVVFASDNGPWESAPARMFQGGVNPWDVGSPGPLRGSKGMTYEGGVRVPGIVRWPGAIPAGVESAEIATLMDLYTTLIRRSGGDIPRDRPVDGRDLWPLLSGRGPALPEAELFYVYPEEVQAVRSGRWKLRLTSANRSDLQPGQAPTPELFDLDVDPGERFNRAAEQPEIVARLRERIRWFSSGLPR